MVTFISWWTVDGPFYFLVLGDDFQWKNARFRKVGGIMSCAGEWMPVGLWMVPCMSCWTLDVPFISWWTLDGRCYFLVSSRWSLLFPVWVRQRKW